MDSKPTTNQEDLNMTTVRETIWAQRKAALEASTAILTIKRKITSHIGVSRFFGDCADEHIGTVPRQIETPYASSPTHLVWLHATLGPVVVVETHHKVYMIYTVDGELGPKEAN